MIWSHKDRRNWHTVFAFLPRRVGDKWVWLRRYEERLARSYWLSSDGAPPPDGACAFVFQRRCRGLSLWGEVTKYRWD